MKNTLTFILLLLTSFGFAQFTIGQPDDIIIVENPFDGFATFDLTLNESQTLNGESPSNVSITYYNTLMDAQAGVFTLPNPTSYNNSANPETIYVKMELISNPSVSDITSFDILVESNFNLGSGNDLIVYEFPFDGSAQFDLTQNETQILNGIDSSSVNISYHNSQADADFGDFWVANPSGYFNVFNPETVYVRVQLLSDPNFYTTTSFDIEVSDDVVNIPSGYFLSTIINQGVDTNNSGNIQSFEALAVSSLHVDELVTNITGLEEFVNITELTSSIPIYAVFDLSLLPLLERLEVFVALGGGPGDLDFSSNPNLKTLIFGNIFITTLDVSNNALLEELTIWGSGLTSLDLNHNSNLQSLSIASNQLLETVFIKNGSDESTNIEGGYWLENWLQSNNPSLEYVCADVDQVAEIQSFAGTDYVVNSFCSTEPGGDFNTIKGNVSFDNNNTGCNPSDAPVPFININYSTSGSPISTVSTNLSGDYDIYVAEPGDYTLEPVLENPGYFNVTPNTPTINIPTINNGTIQEDFCLSANGTIADAEVVIAPVNPSNPGFDAIYKLVYKNKGNQTLSGNVTFQYDDTVLDFVSSTTTPDAQTTGELTFNFTNLLPFETQAIDITLNVNNPMETPPVNIDDVLDFSATVTIDQTEETPDDNSFDFSEVVVGSYDPNDITCLQGDVVPETEIGEFLHYMIRFENTGNAAAQKVVVTTGINPADYNISTLQILDASHDMFLRHNNGLIEFVFENIQLAGGGGHGNILLKIKTQPSLTINDEVEAQADIYFDFNFPIVTNIANTAFQTLSVTNFGTTIDISIYPNPAQSYVEIEGNTSIISISIFDLQGRAVLTPSVKDSALKTRLDISSLVKGIYILQVNTIGGSHTHKLIKD